jgi:hypothetical protein
LDTRAIRRPSPPLVWQDDDNDNNEAQDELVTAAVVADDDSEENFPVCGEAALDEAQCQSTQHKKYPSVTQYFENAWSAVHHFWNMPRGKDDLEEVSSSVSATHQRDYTKIYHKYTGGVQSQEKRGSQEPSRQGPVFS